MSSPKNVTISQSWRGLPKNPGQYYRQFKPKAKEGNSGKILERINNKLATDTERSDGSSLFIHATKGYRTISPRQTAAAIVTAEIKQGHIHPLNIKAIRRALKNMGAPIG